MARQHRLNLSSIAQHGFSAAIIACPAFSDEKGVRDNFIASLNRLSLTPYFMHGQVSHPWTLDELAGSLAMSRSAFSKRFKMLVGVAPLDYLLRWRMRLARALLRRGSTVAVVATHVGYCSESAFGHAFKRIYGHAPKQYWRVINHAKTVSETIP
jgi:AraC-like DNA-binding protein